MYIDKDEAAKEGRAANHNSFNHLIDKISSNNSKNRHYDEHRYLSNILLKIEYKNRQDDIMVDIYICV